MIAATIAIAIAMTTIRSAADAGSSAARPRVVVAVVDNGVNPYHRDFADRGMSVHPSRFLPGYPRTASPLRLTLDREFAAARHADDGTWGRLAPGRLYYVPGTKIAGLVYLPGSVVDEAQKVTVDTEPAADPPRPVIDGSQHGTQVASLLAGNSHGSCPRCLLVVVSAANREAGLAWAARQPWIDIVSNSYGGPTAAPTGGSVAGQRSVGAVDRTSRDAALAGKPVFFAAGNGLSGTGPYTGITPDRGSTWTSPYSGPPWVVAVGAADRATGRPSAWHDVPVDVLSFGQNVPSADARSVDGESTCSGTSCSTPYAAGVAGAALLAVRVAVGDTATGFRSGSLVMPGAHAPAKFRHLRIGRGALVAALLRSATPTSAGPASGFVDGFGLLSRQTVPRLAAMLLGRRPVPFREEEATYAQSERIRTALWGPDIAN